MGLDFEKYFSVSGTFNNEQGWKLSLGSDENSWTENSPRHPAAPGASIMDSSRKFDLGLE